MKNTEIYEKLLDKYGDKQLIVAIEELSELQKEICKYLRNHQIMKKDIIEEIADVEIMLEQIKLYFNFDQKIIDAVKEMKLIRTKERMLKNDN